MVSGSHRMIISNIRVRSGQGRIRDSLRCVDILRALRPDFVQFIDCAVIFPSVMRKAIMPENVVLHKRNAFSLYRIGDHHRRPAVSSAGSVLIAIFLLAVFQSPAKGFMAVPVYLFHIPAEGLPFCPEILQLQCVFAEIQRLHMVMVHDGSEVIQPEMIGKESRFPYLSFIAFSVSQDRENPVRFPVLPGRVGHSHRDRRLPSA